MRYGPDHKPRARERIIKAGRKVFTDVGFDHATIDNIMTEADMTRGGFYKHFRSKEALFVEVVRDGTVEVPDEVPCTVEAMLTRYVDDHHFDDEPYACPLFTFPSDVARSGDEVKEAYEEVAKSIAEVLTKALPNRDNDTALGMLAMSVGCMVIAKSSNDPKFKHAVRQASVKLIFKLVQQRSDDAIR